MSTACDPQADQEAARRREANARGRYVATHQGQPVTVRTVTVQADRFEAEALAAGIVLPGIQAQIDRQEAEDAAITAIGDELASQQPLTP